MLNVAMLGASGRMGRTIVPLVMAAPDLQLSGALVDAAETSVGVDAGVLAGAGLSGVAITADAARALEGAAVAIDFSNARATAGHAGRCVAASSALVIGTTGHDADALSAIQAASRSIPIVMAPNMSVGVNLLLRLSELAARALGRDYDAEVFEAHHRHKVDAPSGTALALGRAVAAGRGADFEKSAVLSRQGVTGPRPDGAIGFSVVRGGDIVGEHRLIFAGTGEQIELVHRAQDRSGFANGALTAARWVVGRPAGLYSMSDVLGI